MKFAMYFPWGRGLGTLGFKWGQHGRHYADLSLRQGTPKNPGSLAPGKVKRNLPEIRLFTALDETGKYGQFHCTRRSWYTLTRCGWRLAWKLTRREDMMGEWKNGKRRPPLYDMPKEGLFSRARSLGQYFKPYRIIDWYGLPLEVISYPFPDGNNATGWSIAVNMRQPDDATTMETFVLENYLPATGPVRRYWR